MGVSLYFPPIGLKPPTSVGKEFNRAPQALKNTEPFDFRGYSTISESLDGVCVGLIVLKGFSLRACYGTGCYGGLGSD